MNEMPASSATQVAPRRGGVRVEIDRLDKDFVARDGRPTHALDNVTASIGDGQFVCVIGPSGCGKSTLLNVLAGFEAPSAGSVSIDDKPVRGPSAEHAVIFQDVHGSLMPWLTALQNTELGLKFAGMSRADRRDRAEEALASVGLSGANAKYPFELSGGMQQRVQIARALALRSRFLLMDEPFGALDYFTRTALQAQLETLFCENEFSAMLVTHDINEAAMLADAVWIMQAGGRLVEVMNIDVPRPRQANDPQLVDAMDYLRGKFASMEKLK